jgi:hypothetical protein
MSLTLALVATAASGSGLFWRSVYSREALPWAAQLRGGDAVNLLVAVPVLLVSVILSRRGSIPARTVWQGSLLLFVYNYAIYAFAVHVNILFLTYCCVLGLSFYALLGSLLSSSPQEMADRYGSRAPVRTLAIVFFLLALAFAAEGIAEIVPATVAGHPPKSVTEWGLVSNPIHVLDLSFFLPAFVIVGVLLWRRRPLAFVLAPVLMAFGLLMTLTVAGLMAAMAIQGLANDYRGAVPFLGVAIGFSWPLARFFRGGTVAESRQPPSVPL